MFNLFDTSQLNVRFMRRRLLASVAAPGASYQRDCYVGRDSYGDPEGDVAGGGAESRTHGGSQCDGQAE